MAGMTATIKQQWLKHFPTVQARAILGSVQPFLSGFKQSANSITSNAVLAADTELTIPQVQVGIPYLLNAVLNISSMAAAGNLQFDFGASTATVQTMLVTSQFYTAAGVQTNGAVQTTLTTAANGGVVAVNIAASISGLITFATPGSFTMRLAQQASSATATVVDINSFMLLEGAVSTVTG